MQYEEMWLNIKTNIEEHIRKIADLFGVTCEIDEDNDYEWGYWLKVKDLYLTIRLLDSIDYEGEDMGFNIQIQITQVSDNYTEELFSCIPYNFTPQAWTADIEELKARLNSAPWDKVMLVLACQ